MQLAEICDLIVDCEHKTAATQESGYPSIRTPNIGRGYFILDNVTRVSEETYRLWTRRAVPKRGDLIMAREAPVGNVAIIPPGLKPCLGQRTLLIRCDKAKAEPSYVSYLLNSPQIQATIFGMASGATVPHLNMKDVRTLPIPELPPLSTQRKIASILSAYDDLIENNLRRIKILEEMAQALYREWFVKFRFPGHEKVRMVDSPLGKIPEGCEVATVGDTFEILGGGTPSKSVSEYWEGGTINWYVPSDLTASGSLFMDRSGNQITEIGLRKSSARLFPAFSVMMTSRATLGVISINTAEACTNQGFITCVPNNRFPLYNLCYWLKENVEQFISLGTGATFKEITKGIFKTIQLVVPENRIADKFEETVLLFGRQILNLQRRNLFLRQTRDLLLPKLVSGELDVSELDISIREEAA